MSILGIPLYIVFCYAIAGVLYALVIRGLRVIFRRAGDLSQSKLRMAMRAAWVMAILAPVYPYAYISALNSAVGAGFLQPVKQAIRNINGDQNVVDYRLLFWTPWLTRVYIVTPCVAGPGYDVGADRAYIVDMVKRDGAWTPRPDFSCVYSDCGSADSFIFPPFSW